MACFELNIYIRQRWLIQLLSRPISIEILKQNVAYLKFLGINIVCYLKILRFTDFQIDFHRSLVDKVNFRVIQRYIFTFSDRLLVFYRQLTFLINSNHLNVLYVQNVGKPLKNHVSLKYETNTYSTEENVQSQENHQFQSRENQGCRKIVCSIVHSYEHKEPRPYSHTVT